MHSLKETTLVSLTLGGSGTGICSAKTFLLDEELLRIIIALISYRKCLKMVKTRGVVKTNMSKRQEKCRDRKKKRETRNAKNPLLLHLLLPLVLYLCRSNRDNTPPPPASLLHPPFPTFTALVAKESQESMHLLQRCLRTDSSRPPSKGEKGMYSSRIPVSSHPYETTFNCVLSTKSYHYMTFFPFCLYYCISYSVHSPPVLLCWTTTVRTSDIFKDLRFS